jgi:hypothetical protein
LKKENAKLKRDIRVLIDEPDSFEAMCIRDERELEKVLESIFWFGSPSIIADSNDNPNNHLL